MTDENLDREDRTLRSQEDRLVRMAQAWIIPILLAVVSALIYPLVSQIGETEKRMADAERGLAVLETQVEHLSRQVDVLERRLEKASSVSSNQSRWPNADLMSPGRLIPAAASAAKP